MPLDVFDYRTDRDNLVTRPEIRARFEYLAPGTVAARHSHDLGTEIWVVLQGRIEFEIEGDSAILEPGQAVVARPGQRHSVRVVGDEPVIQYLSVTPHVKPTHTGYDDNGRPHPPNYDGPPANERVGPAASWSELMARHREQLDKLAAAVRDAEATLDGEAAALLAVVDPTAAKPSLDVMWPRVRALAERHQAMLDSWNELTEASTTPAPGT
jgi:quercetin dioxygenase-like cupin family protein